MAKYHKNRKGCSRCGHCRTWRVNKAFVRAPKAGRAETMHFKTCNRCSRLYRKSGKVTKAEFWKNFRGRDHADSDPEEDDNDEDEDEDEDPDQTPNNNNDHDQGGGSQGGMGHAIAAA